MCQNAQNNVTLRDLSFFVLFRRYIVDFLTFFHLGESLSFQTYDFVVSITNEFFGFDLGSHGTVLFGEIILVNVRVTFYDPVFEFGVIDGRFAHIQGEGIVRREALATFLAVD